MPTQNSAASSEDPARTSHGSDALFSVFGTLVYAIGGAVGFLPISLFFGQPSFAVIAALLGELVLGFRLLPRRRQAIDDPVQSINWRPYALVFLRSVFSFSFGAWVWLFLGALVHGVTWTLFFFRIVQASSGRFLHALDLAGGTIALLFSLAFVFADLTGVSELLFKPTASRSAIGNRRGAINLAMASVGAAAAVALSIWYVYSSHTVIYIPIQVWLFVVSALLAAPSIVSIDQKDAILAISKMLEIQGFTIQRNSSANAETKDPFLAPIDLIARRDDQAYVVAVKAGIRLVPWRDVSAVSAAAYAYGFDRAIPVLVLVGVSPESGLRDLAARTNVRVLELPDAAIARDALASPDNEKVRRMAIRFLNLEEPAKGEAQP